MGNNNASLDTPEGIASRLLQQTSRILNMRPKASVFIVGLFPQPGSRKYKQVPLEHILHCNDMIRKLCSAHNFVYINALDGIMTNPHFMSRDGIHLTNKGKIFLQNKIELVISKSGFGDVDSMLN